MATAGVLFLLLVAVMAAIVITTWYRIAEDDAQPFGTSRLIPGRIDRVWPIAFVFDETSLTGSTCGNDWEISSNGIRFRMEATDPCARGSVLGRTVQPLPDAPGAELSAFGFRVDHAMTFGLPVALPTTTAVLGSVALDPCEPLLCDDTARFMALDAPGRGAEDWVWESPRILRGKAVEAVWSIDTATNDSAGLAPPSTAPPSTNPGWDLDVSVEAPRIEMRQRLDAQALPIGSTRQFGATVVDAVVVDVQVPSVDNGTRLEVTVPGPATYLRSIVDPQGGRYAFPDDWAEPDEDRVYVVPDRFVKGGGPGTYRLVFDRVQAAGSPVVPQAEAPALGAFLLALPLVTALLVQASLATYRKGRLPDKVPRLEVLWSRIRLVLIASVAVVVLVAATGAWRLLGVWPPGVLGTALLSVLVVLAFASVAVWLRASRLVRDLSENDAARERALSRDLDRRAREMEDFAYAVSHDLRTPLMAMKWLLRDLPEPKARRARADFEATQAQLQDNLDGMEAFIGDLLEIAKVGDLAVSDEAVDLDDVAAQVARRLAPLVREKDATLDLAPPFGAWRGDPTLYGQVLSNLVGNALKYGCPQPGGNVRVGVEREGREARLVVEDDGPGVPAAERERVLEMFARASTAGSEPGTGLGLSLVGKVAAVYGGSVRVEQAPSGGARFVVVLPADRGRPPVRPDPERKPLGHDAAAPA